MFKNVDGRMDDGVTGILLAHPRAFGSGELKNEYFKTFRYSVCLVFHSSLSHFTTNKFE